jgi:hypothetical protein
MANEIKVLERNGDNIRLLFLYPISQPATIAGSNIVETPSAGLDSLALQTLDATEITSLDDGTALYRLVDFRVSEGMTTQQMADRARQIYNVQQSVEQAAYLNRYEFVGTELTP